VGFAEYLTHASKPISYPCYASSVHLGWATRLTLGWSSGLWAADPKMTSGDGLRTAKTHGETMGEKKMSAIKHELGLPGEWRSKPTGIKMMGI
jgi:hypothetical protein